MKMTTLTLALAGAGLLSACGGSKDPQPPLPPASVTLTGVAARGAALAGAAISARCVTGTGTAVAGADGAYALTVAGGVLPCVVSATADTLVLHSVATGTGGTATSNITPLTELLVAQISGAQPAAYAAAANATTLVGLDSADVAAAQTVVLATLQKAGVNTAAIGNLVTGTLVAATGTTTGNGYDQVLDALSSALNAAGSTLAQLTTTVAAAAAAGSGGTGGGSVGNGLGNGVASLPADLLLKPRAPNCAALRSTSYNVFVLRPSFGPGDMLTSSFSIDAPTLALNFGEGGTDVWTEAGECAYTFSGTPGTQDEIKVLPSGIIVARVWESGTATYRLAIALPAQTITLAELAGEWNLMGWERDSGNADYGIVAGRGVVNSSGQITSAACFSDPLSASTCTAETGIFPSFRLNSAGALEIASTDPTDSFSSQVFAFRSGSGDLMLLEVSKNSDILDFWTRKPGSAGALPAVGRVTSNWNFNLASSGVVGGPIGFTTNTVTSVDVASSSFTRNGTSNGGTVTVSQTLQPNFPRLGITYRQPANTTDSNGAPATVREFYAQDLRGMGLTPLYLPSTGTAPAVFVLSAAKP